MDIVNDCLLHCKFSLIQEKTEKFLSKFACCHWQFGIRNVSVNVVTNSNWSCLLISAPKVHWRVQPTAARRSGRFNKMHGALRALHVSLNNVCTRTVRKWLKRNNGHLITLQIWMEWIIVSGKRRAKLIWNLHSNPKTFSELKVALHCIFSFPSELIQERKEKFVSKFACCHNLLWQFEIDSI